MYSQLHRRLLCVVSSVWLILPFRLYLWLPTTICILVCLEHSFWIVQQSNASDGFIKAWESHLKTHWLIKYLRSKGSVDWSTTKHSPSDAERAECRKKVLNNLLCEFRPWNWTEIADIVFSARPKISEKQYSGPRVFAWVNWSCTSRKFAFSIDCSGLYVIYLTCTFSGQLKQKFHASPSYIIA